jgi:hypothetical protein
VAFQADLESFTFSSEKTFSHDCFEQFADGLPPSVFRAKGFIALPDGAQLSLRGRLLGPGTVRGESHGAGFHWKKNRSGTGDNSPRAPGMRGLKHLTADYADDADHWKHGTILTTTRS